MLMACYWIKYQFWSQHTCLTMQIEPLQIPSKLDAKFHGKTHDTNSSKSNKAQQTPAEKTNFHCLLCVLLFHVLVFYSFFWKKMCVLFVYSKLKWTSISKKKIQWKTSVKWIDALPMVFFWWHFACSWIYVVYAIKLKGVLNVSYPFIEHVTHFQTDTFSQEFRSCNIFQKLRRIKTRQLNCNGGKLWSWWSE